MATSVKTTAASTALANFTAPRGAYRKLDYNPVFRGSAIFYAVVSPDIDTRVSFMDYWRRKNGIEHVSALVTLRNAAGERLFREFIRIDKEIYAFSVRDMLQDEADFEGSIEVEIYSDEDIKFAFSAINVFYVTRDAVSLVHANQRIFNDLSDMYRNAPLNPWQTGFDIRADDQYEGFVTLINGPLATAELPVPLQIYNASGECLELQLKLRPLPAYGVETIRFGELPGVPAFLNGGTGWAKFDVQLNGVFQRFVCGNWSPDRSRLLATHTFFDCSHHADYYSQADVPEGEYGSFVPFGIPQGLDLDLIFYPVSSPAKVLFSLELRDRLGAVEHTIVDFAEFVTAGPKTVTVDVREMFRNAGVTDLDGKLGVLHMRAAGGTDLIPNRMLYGTNYRVGEMGSNISSPVHANPAYATTNRSYHWGPVMLRKGSVSHVILCHLAKQRDAWETADVEFMIWGEEGIVHRRLIESRNGTATIVVVEDVLHDCGLDVEAQDGTFFWYTFESKSPNITGFQLHTTSQGFVGADHSY